MPHSDSYNSLSNAETPDAITRRGPTYDRLFEVNEQLQAHAANPDIFSNRFNDPPPPYRSASTTPRLVQDHPAESEQDNPELRQELLRQAAALPQAFAENRFRGWSTAAIDAYKRRRKELSEAADRRQKEQDEAISRYYSREPPGTTLFGDPDGRNKPASGSHHRKRKRTEVELLVDAAHEMVGSEVKTSKRARGEGATQGSQRTERHASSASKAKHPAAGPRRSTRIAEMTKRAPIDAKSVPRAKRTKSTASRQKKSKGEHSSKKTAQRRATRGKGRRR